MFTGSRNPDDVARAGQLGADRYLVKPMDAAGFERIGQTARAWLEAKAYDKTR
jgi:AmiR/NasT family two-component response regulator